MRALAADVMHRSQIPGISSINTPCLQGVNMKRLTQTTKGAHAGPFPLEPLVNVFTKGALLVLTNGVTDQHGLA